MQDKISEEVTVDIAEWVDKAKSDPAAYIERQATEIFLTTLGTAEPYCKKFFLKGGILMGVVYDSPRQTADIDYSTIMEPNPEIIQHLQDTLTEAFPRVAAILGYPDLICKIQTIKLRPKESNFTTAQAPGFEITVGYAKRGTNQETLLQKGKAATVLNADISFKEPVGGIQLLKLGSSDTKISAYSLMDVIAEKLRALLQQEKRNRYRRQDIYDLNLLIQRFAFDADEKIRLHKLLLEKCHARDVFPRDISLEQEEIVRRAKSEWHTLELEIGEVPDFDKCFNVVNQFYKSLPWDKS